MLALKKKREAEKKAAEEAAAATAATEAAGSTSTAPSTTTTATTTASGGTEKVSLLGIGGRKTGAGASAKNGDSSTAKKRTPGEIRIQKGTTDRLLDGILAFATFGQR
jgi:hypothetical protein